MKAKINLPNYSVLDQIRVQQQEEMKIKNHLTGDNFIINNDKIIINTNLCGKSWYLKQDSLKYIKIRIDIQIILSIGKLYHVDIQPIKVTFTTPADYPGMEDYVLNVIELREKYSDEYMFKNHTFTITSFYFTDLIMHLNNVLFEIFYILMDSDEDNRIIHLEHEEFVIDEKDYTPLEADDEESRAKKIKLRKELISQYTRIVAPFEKNEKYIKSQQIAIQHINQTSESAKMEYNQEIATNAPQPEKNEKDVDN